MSQNAQILSHLRKYSTINPMEALNKYGVFRLAARIYDLRVKGHRIDTLDVYSGNKKFAAYTLVKEACDV